MELKWRQQQHQQQSETHRLLFQNQLFPAAIKSFLPSLHPDQNHPNHPPQKKKTTTPNIPKISRSLRAEPSRAEITFPRGSTSVPSDPNRLQNWIRTLGSPAPEPAKPGSTEMDGRKEDFGKNWGGEAQEEE